VAYKGSKAKRSSAAAKVWRSARKQKRQARASSSDASILRDAGRYLMNTYRRPPIVFVRGRGCYVYDHRGRKYLDFLGGIAVNALGYAHPRLVRVMRRESARAVHVSNLFHHPFQGPLARKLAAWSGMDRVFFTNSGTEAIEGALKLARVAARKRGPEKTRILALEGSFHGRTFGALSITHPAKYRDPFTPLIPGVEFVHFNDVTDLEAKFDDSVCAIVLEAIQGEGGIFPLSGAFWARARELASHYGAALIADEIQCGLGRTGLPFAYQMHAGAPDIVVVAKPLAGGLPLGAILARESFAEAFAPGLHGSTFGGGPLACATALEFLTTVEDEELLENVRERGGQLRAGLSRLAAQIDLIREIRGEGLIIGLALAVEGRDYVAAALRRGLIINCTHEHVIRLLPPFIVTERQVEDFLTLFSLVLRETKRPVPMVPKAAEATAPRLSVASR
jgi:acetylornithine aminotransferase/acetylornithine/N-succinyldiaminopimelate aminotransferase